MKRLPNELQQIAAEYIKKNSELVSQWLEADNQTHHLVIPWYKDEVAFDWLNPIISIELPTPIILHRLKSIVMEARTSHVASPYAPYQLSGVDTRCYYYKRAAADQFGNVILGRQRRSEYYLMPCICRYKEVA